MKSIYHGVTRRLTQSYTEFVVSETGISSIYYQCSSVINPVLLRVYVIIMNDT